MTAVLRRGVAAGGPVDEDLVEELAGLLVAHAEREEVGVFAALRDVGVEPDYVGRFEGDHRRIEELLAGVARGPRAVRALIELVEDHILREETDMFPAARQLLDSGSLGRRR